jgi:hypothetical protein
VIVDNRSEVRDFLVSRRARIAPDQAGLPAFGANRRVPENIARFVFLSPRARAFFLNWESAANDTVAILRTEAGRNPYDQGLTNLVGELCTRSEEFRTRWAAHNVRLHRTGLKDVHHPVVGDLQRFDQTEVANPTPSH